MRSADLLPYRFVWVVKWLKAVVPIWTIMLAGQHFYSGPSLARDDRVQSRPCNLGWTSKEEVWSHRCTKTCCLPSLSLRCASLCPLLIGLAWCSYLGNLKEECDPQAKTYLLLSASNPLLKKFLEKMLPIGKWTLFTENRDIPILFPPFHRMTRSSHVPVILGKTKRRANDGVLGCCSRRNMFVTTV